MATVTRNIRVIGNPGNIIGLTLGNPARKTARKKGGSTMAKATKKGKKKASYSKSRAVKKNPARHMKSKPFGRPHRRRQSNPALGPSVNTALFTIAGAVGSKIGTQAILGSKNVGVMGYLGNAAVGAALFFLFAKLFRNRSAAEGIMYGTLVQIILRAINDYTPFGQYVANLGMGDYQMQSFVTPQVLVDPMQSAALANGWNPPGTPAPMPALIAASPANAAAGTGLGGSMYSLGRGNSGNGMYAVA